MSDDQDGCEWVNVSSGTGLPRVVPDKRPLNCCVCVCVLFCVDKPFDKTNRVVFLTPKYINFQCK